MSIRMRALKSYRGRPGEGEGQNRSMVRAGRETVVEDERRAQALEMVGNAVRIEPGSPEDGSEQTIKNRAAELGPQDLAGGETGEASERSSSQEDQAQPKSTKKSRPSGKKKSSK